MTNNQISATSKAVSDGLALLLVAFFAFPILGQAVPVVNTLPGDLTSYVLLLVIPLSLASLLWGLRWNNFNRIQKALLIYCLYYIATVTIKFAIYGMGRDRVGLQLYRERTQYRHLTEDLQP
jgi:glucan phosphoethanolaminetransferase (alkaline phosphatase superfamily)